MEFRVLGPLEVRRDGSAVGLPGGKPRALLAVLLLHANQPVSADRLAVALWGEDAPAGAARTVQVYVSRLRRALGEDELLTTSRAGYRLRVRPGELDLEHFERLVEDGRRALAQAHAEQAAGRLREALELWRGPPLADLAFEPFAQAEITRLEEQRLAAVEARVEADLAAGRHAELVPELQRLVGENPLRERLHGQLMLALYRSGRQADALEAYHRLRHFLMSEIGVEPGAEARRVHEAMLRQDAGLEPPRPRGLGIARSSGQDLQRQILPPDAALDLRSRSNAVPGPAPASAGPTEGHPETRFVQSGDVSIAYQVLGDGPLDLVLVHGWVCSFHAGWEREQIARFYRRLASIGRLILFDKRGTGLSDRVKGIAPLEERMDDVRAVMDAVGSQRAALLGISEGGPMVALFAATYPQRTAALVAMGTYARRSAAPDYPLDIPQLSLSAEEWGLPFARAFIARNVPTIVGDDEAVRWYASYFVRGASPGAVVALRAMNAKIDVRHVLPTIGVPTLVLYRSQEYLREATRYMGEEIPGARVVELPGADHLPWEGNQDDVLDEVERFLATVGDDQGAERILATILTTRLGGDALMGDDVTDSDPALRHQALVRNQLPRFRGEPISTSSAETSARFDGPARAIRCARAVVDLAAGRGLDVRAGLHTAECVVVEGKTGGPAAEISASIAALAQPGEVLVSSTVRDLVAGSGIPLEERTSAAPATGLADLSLFAIGSSAVAV